MAGLILIVDDNEHVRSIFAQILRSKGYETVEASTGLEAIEKAKSMNPSLVLMDIDLPDMTGVETVREIKKDVTIENIPIIGCSAFLDFREAALDAGMIDYLIKPISAELIAAKAAEFIQTEQ